ncbi:MAG: hypothetical protein AB7P76_01640 [Candidatus Melainabacteria bacterium]
MVADPVAGGAPASTPAHQAQTGDPARLRRVWLWAALAAVLVWVLYIPLSEFQMMGFTHDDGIYAITAKAIAQGKGFRLLHVVHDGPGWMAQVKYPVLYPLILSVVWLLNPAFPQNLVWMASLTTGFAMAGLAVMVVWLVRQKGLPLWLSLVILFLVATNFFFIFWSTSIMSEPVYFFFSLLTLWFAEQRMDAGALSRRDMAILIVLSTLTFHARIVGATLLAAIGCCMLLRQRWREALTYGLATGLVTVVPWVLWTKLNFPGVTPYNYALVNAYSNYGFEFWMNSQASMFSSQSNFWLDLRTCGWSMLFWLLADMFNIIPNFFLITKKIWPGLDKDPVNGLIAFAVMVVSCYTMLGLYVTQAVHAVFRFLRERCRPAISISGLYLVLYVLTILLWRYEGQMGRFLLMVLPLLWYFFFKPFFLIPRPVWRNALIVFFCLLSLTSTPNTLEVLEKFRRYRLIDTENRVPELWSDYQATFDFFNQHTRPDEPIASVLDTVFYLYTGHPTFILFFNNIERAEAMVRRDGVNMLKSMDHYHVKYLVGEPYLVNRIWKGPLHPTIKAMRGADRPRFILRFVAPGRRMAVYEILPPGQSPVPDPHKKGSR